VVAKISHSSHLIQSQFTPEVAESALTACYPLFISLQQISSYLSNKL